jgi:hypothetical protein
MAPPSIARVASRAVPWLLGALAFVACASTEEDAFSVQYRRPPVRTLALRDASMAQTPPRAAGGAPPVAAPGCRAAFCPGAGTFPGCCLPDNTCGVDFGMGACSVAPIDAGSGGAPGAGGAPAAGGTPAGGGTSAAGGRPATGGASVDAGPG